MSQADFIKWLKTVTKSKVQDFFRKHRRQPPGPGGSSAQRRLAEVPDPAQSRDCADAGGQRGDDRALDEEAVRRGLAQVEEKTQRAFFRHVLDEQPAAKVAEELGMSVSAVYQAKYRVMGAIRRARDELGK